jgi:archaemetzincin
MGKIILVKLSAIEPAMLEAIRQGVERAFKRPTGVISTVQSLGYAYDRSRRQYVSPRILARLRRMRKAPTDRILGVTNVDLYSAGYEFVFGEAEIATGVGTLSLYRLRPETADGRPDLPLLEERAIKEATHELGHLYHLGHCPDPKCVMHFCPSLRDVDVKRRTFCSRCHPELESEFSNG